MGAIEAVIILSVMFMGLVVAWAQGLLQSPTQLRRRAIELLVLADAKDAYRNALPRSTQHWTKLTGVEESGEIDPDFISKGGAHDQGRT